MKVARTHLAQAFEALLTTGASKAIKYVAPDHVVCVCLPTGRTKNGNIRSRKRDRSVSFVVTIGKPNYAERRFIKTLKAAGEPFPVKKIQLKFPAKRRR